MSHLRKSEWLIAPVSLKTATDLVQRYHYSGGGANTGVFFHGLFNREAPDVCVGIAWWLPPTKNAAKATYPEWQAVLSLTRLAIAPEVPTNGASFLIGRSIREIRKDGRWKCLVTYADEWQGHEGKIYRATNWEDCGLTKPEPKWVDDSGRQVARKATRTRTNAEMIALGYRVVGSYSKRKFRMLL